MPYRIGADAILLLHLAFIAFVVFGALLALRWRWMSLVHVPAAAWGIFVELTGRTCPLTFIENSLRIHAGSAGYAESFVEHYLLRIIYPEALTGAHQAALAGLILVVNGAIYGWVLHRLHRSAHA
jgi:hypothetical protein